MVYNKEKVLPEFPETYEKWIRALLEVPPAGQLVISRDLDNRLKQLFALGIIPREARRFIQRNYPDLLENLTKV